MTHLFASIFSNLTCIVMVLKISINKLSMKRVLSDCPGLKCFFFFHLGLWILSIILLMDKWEWLAGWHIITTEELVQKGGPKLVFLCTLNWQFYHWLKSTAWELRGHLGNLQSQTSHIRKISKNSPVTLELLHLIVFKVNTFWNISLNEW